VGLHSGIVTKVRYHTFITHSVLFLSVQVSKPIYDSSLSISIQESPSIQTLIDGKYYGFMAIESKGDMTRIEDTRPDTVHWWIKYITYYATSLSTLSGVMIMGGLLALDPTGTFFRFTKILQIVNKLYFININYGKRLEAFLADSIRPYTPLPSHGQNLMSSRQRLEEMSTPLDIWSELGPFLGIYIVTFILRSLILIPSHQDWVNSKIGIYFCHYANKVHLIIFNLVFIDFIWLAPRTLLHSRDLPLAHRCRPLPDSGSSP